MRTIQLLTVLLALFSTLSGMYVLTQGKLALAALFMVLGMVGILLTRWMDIKEKERICKEILEEEE